MIAVKEACAIIGAAVIIPEPVKCDLSQAHGRLLRESLYADRMLPPFDRVSMDGIAIDFSAWQDGQREFIVEGVHGAGRPAPALSGRTQCFEVMTGAILPVGCNCVIPYEQIKETTNEAGQQAYAVLNENKIKKMGNIHLEGSDYQAKQLLLGAGCRLHSPQIAVAASIGRATLLVSPLPSIAIVSTGDELVDVGHDVAPWQIYRSNAHALSAALNDHGYTTQKCFHLEDDENAIRKGLTDILAHHDVVILSGGVSMGKFDYIPKILAEFNVDQKFHKISQRPGKPFWFGVGEQGQRVFALPGNPVSTVICFYRYVLDYLRACAGDKNFKREKITLKNAVTFKPNLTYFLPVQRIAEETDSGVSYVANPKPTNGSGDFTTLAYSDGFIELPQLAPGESIYPAGLLVDYYAWR